MTISLSNTTSLELKVSDELCLKTLSPDTVSSTYVAWLNDTEIVQFTEQRFQSHSIDEVREFVAVKLASESDAFFGIYLEGRHVGNVKLGPINWRYLTGEVSFLIGDKSCWGKGVATAAVSAVSDFAFAELGLKKLKAGYYAPNIGSQRVFEKCGYSVEGVRKRDVILNGERVDVVMVGRFS